MVLLIPVIPDIFGIFCLPLQYIEKLAALLIIDIIIIRWLFFSNQSPEDK